MPPSDNNIEYNEDENSFNQSGNDSSSATSRPMLFNESKDDCNEIELNGEPIFYSYKLEGQEETSLDVFLEPLVSKNDHEEIPLDFEFNCPTEIVQPDLKLYSSKSAEHHIEGTSSRLKENEVPLIKGLISDTEHVHSDLDICEQRLNSPMATLSGLNNNNKLAFDTHGETNGKAHVLLFLDFHGEGQLDYYIEDDELKEQRLEVESSPTRRV